MTLPKAVKGHAPGGIGNLGPGLDILGCALEDRYDSVDAMLTSTTGVRIDDPGHPDLPRDPQRHASAIAANAVLQRAGVTDRGVALKLHKGLPLSGGQGGSAASAIAAAVAVNALLGSPLETNDLLRAGLASEERVAGRHLDNLAPSLLGGIVLIRSIEPPDLIQLPVPSGLVIVIAHPQMRMRTADARAVLPASVDRETALAQATAVATMISAFWKNDLSLLRGAVQDRIAEPARAPFLPGFTEAKLAAMNAGALGCSIAGGGPSAFALTDDQSRAESILTAMLSAYDKAGVRATGRVARVDQRGAFVEPSAPW